MAHELNQPLTAVTNYTDALDIKLRQLDVGQSELLISLAKKAGDQARLCGEIVKRLRRLLSHRGLSAEPGDFHRAVRQSADLLAGYLGDNGIDVQVQHIGDGGPVSFDPVQLHQMIAHLVSNAVCALKDAEVKQINITSDVRENEFELRVSDSGCGVPEARKNAIFESFVSDNLSGVGLGLPIVKTIANAHSGKIWVEDNPEGGAVFRVVIPMTV